MRRSLAARLVVSAVADEKKDAALKPIPVATLDRKEPVGYEKDVDPIFAAKCHVCHSGNLTEGKFDLGTHAALMKGGKKGPAVVPGKADGEPPVADEQPPKQADHAAQDRGNPLTPQELALLKLWIDQGAKGPAVDVRVAAEGRRRAAAGAGQAGPGGRRQPGQERRRRRPRQPGPPLRRQDRRLPQDADRPDAEDARRQAGRTPPTCRWSRRWPTARTARRSPPAASRRSTSGTPSKGDDQAAAHRLRRPRRGPRLLAPTASTSPPAAAPRPRTAR